MAETLVGRADIMRMPRLIADRLGWLTFDRLVALLLFVTVAAFACVMPAQNDTWWHLRAGEEIWRSGEVSLRDTFSHTVYGGYWPEQEWLSEAVFYAIYRVGGLPLLTAAAATVATATWIIIWLLTPGPPKLRLLLVALGSAPASIAWSLRPHLVTLLMLSLTALLIQRRRLWPIPLVFLLWANFHGGFPLGLICLGASSLWAAVNDRRQVGRFAAVSITSALATNATPLGFSEWWEIAKALERIQQYPISEWRPPGLLMPMYVPFWCVAAALVALAIAGKVWRRNPSPEGPLIWSALALLPLAIKASRNVAPFLLLAVPAVGSLLDARSPQQVISPQRRGRPFVNATLLASAVILGVVAVAFAWTVQVPRLGWHPLPSDVITAIRSCPDPLYNRWDEGGFLIWFTPDRRVFIDGRQDPYPPEFVGEHIRAETSGDYERLFERYDIRCAFLPETSPVARRLREDGWNPRYDDGQWLVLVKP
jgi:hypothetical protein